MKIPYISFIAGLSMALILGACGGGSDASAPTIGDNLNANSKPYTTRLEFPRLSADAQTAVRVYLDGDEVNYSMEWDKDLQSQHWSCYQLYASNLKHGKGVKRYYGNPQYPADPLFKTRDLIKGSGYDHGHICPSADRMNRQVQNDQTFYLTNMQPQAAVFNGSKDPKGIHGPWWNMESQVRKIAERTSVTDTLYICKGGTIGKGGTLSHQVFERRHNGLLVPGYFFVALLQVKNGKYHSIGLLFPHGSNKKMYDVVGVPFTDNGDVEDRHLAKYARSIDQLEKETGFDFFCNLPDSRENVIEAQCDPSLWGFD